MHPEKDPDELRQAWQTQGVQTRVTIDADLLRQEVQREQRNFRMMILCRDFREVFVSLLLIPVWFYLGSVTASPWTWYLEVPALIGVTSFMLAFRIRHPQKPSDPDESLLQSTKNSLSQVEDQIWLLRNVHWWYLLPLGLPLLVFFAHISWQGAVETNEWLVGVGAATFLFVFVVGLYYWIYRLNQRSVESQLEPQRQELLTLLASLDEESTSEGPEDRVALPSLPFAGGLQRAPTGSKSSLVVSAIATLAGMLLLVAVVKVVVNTDPSVFSGQGYPMRSPFTAVRWQDAQPEVQVDGQWRLLVSLDGLPVDEIVAFSQETYGNQWRKRFEEDLVELLIGMGHPLQDTVTLVVQSLTSAETKVLEDVPMTYANRRTIRNAAQAREKRKP